MPTILFVFGLRVAVYPNDHRPAHVHVIGNDKEAVFNLGCPGGPLELRENYGFSKQMIGKIAAALDENLATLCKSWREIHGHF